MKLEHEYWSRIQKFLELDVLPRGELASVQVLHDPDCGIYGAKGICDCDPDITVDLSNGGRLSLDKHGRVRLAAKRCISRQSKWS